MLPKSWQMFLVAFPGIACSRLLAPPTDGLRSAKAASQSRRSPLPFCHDLLRYDGTDLVRHLF